MVDQPNQPSMPGNPLSSDATKFHAVLVNEANEPFVISARTAIELANELKKFYGTRTVAFPFFGDRWAISKGPTQRYLLISNGNRVPLFDSEPNHVPDPSGSLDTRDETLQEHIKR